MGIFGLILCGVLLSAAGQILLKAGMNQIGEFEFTLTQIIPVGLKVISNIPIISGLFFYVLSLILWLLVLSRVQVSYAYPMLSIGYVINAIAAYFLFSEPLSSMRILGIFIIIAGVYLISQTR